MKHYLLAAALAALAVVQTSCTHKQHEEEERPSYPVTTPLRTDTEIVRPYVCQIRSIRHIEIRALERGYLQEIYVDEGQFVHQGQKMFQILPLVYQAEKDKAEAEAQLAEIEYKNTATLQEKNVVSSNELAMAKAKWDKAKAELALAKTHLGFTEIRAPFDGIMDQLHVRHGSLLDEGDLLTTLSDNSKMWVYFNVAEAEYLNYEKARKERSERLTVRLQMANGQVFDQVGTVETIEADFNNETGNVAFRATFPNPDGLLRFGETGTVLMTVPLHNVLVIPQQATFDILDKKFVYTVDDQGVVHSRQIAVAEELPHLFVIGKGLDGSENILLDGLRKVRDGDHIGHSFEEPSKVMASLDVPAE